MPFKPTRTFSAAEGDKSTLLAGPEQLIHDIDMLCAMFDPEATHDDEEETPGGLNLEYTQLITPDQEVSPSGFAGNGSALTILSHIVRLLKLITGETNWFNTPDASIAELAAAEGYVHPNHTGDVTSVGDGATTIAAKAVTLSKMADVASGRVFYRKSPGSGAPEVQTLATLKTDLNITEYTHPNHTGDVTSAGDGATTIAAKAVTLAKMGDMPSGTLIYRKTAGEGVPQYQAIDTLKADLMPATNVEDNNTTTGVTDRKIKFYTCTQEEYEAIVTKDPATLYFIKEA